jgi:hypothetical protein
MTNLLVHNYYYRYREKRKQIKEQLIDTENYEEAKTRLEEAITEHETKYPVLQRDFNYGERLVMDHALRHLNTVIGQNDPGFTDNGQIKHQSDIVKEVLLQNPKSDYFNPL